MILCLNLPNFFTLLRRQMLNSSQAQRNWFVFSLYGAGALGSFMLQRPTIQTERADVRSNSLPESNWLWRIRRPARELAQICKAGLELACSERCGPPQPFKH
jgi:hypothetical protein